ncbi:Xaa-Pro dipeptidyl-peptidase [Lentilactobacillus fungorum]|uniref:Xaa-Pro dipeptidyl-peptidase n=1 Tax=Lentilactobacillus fungorum TaxID=2201250 RepID=A0ABQ3W127_9LACO|nr:Xaa-Pro dipeptidyl-peptidase [Lentilactobacillus fungorum]GHP14535.1 Xaa-Pro dipeptidyl-peptidase [Lentilactobacillus fungorum]
MKINQFAYVPTNHQQIVKELADIRFLSSRTAKISDPVMLFRQFLLKFYLEKQGLSTRTQKVANLMATKDLNAYDYTATQSTVTKVAFYNVGLQLLGFQVGLDFELDQPLAAITKYHLPKTDIDGTLDRDHLIDAWYRLLNTRTKYGQTLIDYLAGQGYYHQFIEDTSFKRPLIFNGKAQAVFDTSKLIREVVYVEAPLDTDHDGQRDLLKAEIIRPAETEAGLKVPVVFTESPYDQGVNDKQADDLTHQVNQPLARKTPNDLTYDDVKVTYHNDHLPNPRSAKSTTEVAEETFVKNWTYSLNDYFLARGFAVVYSSGIGTQDSDGVRTTGTPDETISATAIIEWLHGDRQAFTNRHDQIAIRAWWSNGNVGMTGRSYLGTLSTAAALTGVDGLKTAVVEAGISNYYEYYRENGLVVAPGGFQGEDTDVLGELTFSREQTAADYLKIKDTWLAQLKKLTSGQDRKSGNYNSFWDARNLLKEVNIKADMLLVHGLNDWNVKLSHVYNLRNRLKKEPITQKLVLHQGQHEYLNNFRSVDFTDIVNLWLTNKLLGTNNQANQIIPDVLVQDNATPETWHPYQDWGDAAAQKISLADKRFTDLNENNSFSDHLDDDLFKHYTANTAKWRHDLLTKGHTKMDQHCIKLVSEPLSHDLIVDGRAKISLRAASSANVGLLSVALVDYGKAKRLTAVPQVLEAQKIITGYQWRKDDLKEFLPEKKASAYKKFTDAHMNMQNRTNSYKVDDLQPSQKYTFEMLFQPTFWRLLAGHQFGIVIYATDMDYTIRGNQNITYAIDLGASNIELPLLRADANHE